MLSQKLRQRTDTVSFRIGSGLRLSLEEEAKKSGVSLNTLVSQILTYHTGWGRYARMLKLIPMSKDHLREAYNPITRKKQHKIEKTLAKPGGGDNIPSLFQRIDRSIVWEFTEIRENTFN